MEEKKNSELTVVYLLFIWEDKNGGKFSLTFSKLPAAPREPFGCHEGEPDKKVKIKTQVFFPTDHII